MFILTASKPYTLVMTSDSQNMLNRVPAEPLDRPYELKTAARGLRSHAEHYIMSSHGIARINKGVISEYSTLQEWDHHRRQANCLPCLSTMLLNPIQCEGPVHRLYAS